MSQILAVCGLLCNECDFLGKSCQGCHEVKGATFWAVDSMPDKKCPLYKCAVVDKKYVNCGQCSELPCKTFTDMKDPNASEEQHQEGLKKRVKRLKV
jgi:hypothetical protein